MFKKNNNPRIVINMWNNYDKYYDVFDKKIFNGKYKDFERIQFNIFNGKEYEAIGNIKIVLQDEAARDYLITGVNTAEEYRHHMLNKLYFSWAVLYLMKCNENKNFHIFIDHGVNIKNAMSTGKYIYDYIFDKNNKNVSVSFERADRFFPCDERKEDRNHFQMIFIEKQRDVYRYY